MAPVSQEGARGAPLPRTTRASWKRALPPRSHLLGLSVQGGERISQVRMFAHLLHCKQKALSPQASFPQALFAPGLWFLGSIPLPPHIDRLPRARALSPIVSLSEQENQGPQFLMACCVFQFCRHRHWRVGRRVLEGSLPLLAVTGR